MKSTNVKPLPMKRASVFCDGLDHPECVATHPDGRLFAGGEAGQIYQISRDGKRVEQIATTDGFILGIAISPDGSWLAACDLRKHCIWRLDLATHKLSEFATKAAGHRLSIPNSIAFARDGSMFVTDSGAFRKVNGKVLRFAPDGTGRVWHAGPFNFANGLALAPSRDAVYIVCSFLPGVERVAIQPDGSAGRRTVVARMPKTVPDGIAFDATGNVYVSCYAPPRIYRINPRGKVSVVFDDWEAHTISNPTNVAFGGRKFDQLFVANLGRWHVTKIDLRVRGAPLACGEAAPRDAPARESSS